MYIDSSLGHESSPESVPDDGDIPDPFPLALDGPLIDKWAACREPDGPIDLEGEGVPSDIVAS